MKELLLELVNRLEQQDLKMLTLFDRLDALQQSFDSYHSEAVEEARPASDSAREALDSRYEGIRRLISKFLD
jgi:uncharacterized coiled-coil DUF342 family protein